MWTFSMMLYTISLGFRVEVLKHLQARGRLCLKLMRPRISLQNPAFGSSEAHSGPELECEAYRAHCILISSLLFLTPS